ncbi:MAG: FAD-binding oxidoreductase [Oscillatoria sp. SIO1A7]|nr:FAD-binding oxidoreductase [Oscillatoria sp. SIO1A7]
MNAIAQKLESIVGSSGVSTWDDLEPARLPKLKALSGPEGDKPPDCIVFPQTQAELAEAIALAYENRWAMVPCGAGSKLDWGGIVSNANLVVSTERLNRLIDHAIGDLTVTVEAGMKYGELQKMLAKTGQFLAIDPTYPQAATIGGIVATADTGSLRQRYNSVRDQLLGISFVRADGKLTKGGGRVVKNVAGYDLMKLLTGSYGTLGAIAQVTFRLYPQPAASQTVFLTGSAEAIATAAKTLLASALTPISTDLLSASTVRRLGSSGMGLLVRFQSVPESVAEQSQRVLELGEKLGLQGQAHPEETEATLWEGLRKTIQESDRERAIACKIGIRPSEAAAALVEFEALTASEDRFPLNLGMIHAASGLGRLRLVGETTNVLPVLERMRNHCQSKGGFLTILEAPIEIKQKIDVWGYAGNAIDLMSKIKKQFDSENILSPNRFIV